MQVQSRSTGIHFEGASHRLEGLACLDKRIKPRQFFHAVCEHREGLAGSRVLRSNEREADRVATWLDRQAIMEVAFAERCDKVSVRAPGDGGEDRFAAASSGCVSCCGLPAVEEEHLRTLPLRLTVVNP